ncbi:hypothetical protein [Antrihabitans sp. YC2-6]|uniref:hypothetical protein n=1 Tax=Antrihabitans sp. YC2-6 TaxID=2799498 RepID=UPI0018F7B940|nr:hypothetical protein [Antrihabitans sp. YC2-6]MBJ8347883.1 hypothetical protein [Antrihabitans sp. YC2-6]
MKRIVIDVVACVVLVGLGVWCWNIGVQTTPLSPEFVGASGADGTYYSGGWIALAACLVAAGGAFLVDAVGRLVRPSP